jgi:hypothetical protein
MTEKFHLYLAIGLLIVLISLLISYFFFQSKVHNRGISRAVATPWYFLRLLAFVPLILYWTRVAGSAWFVELLLLSMCLLSAVELMQLHQVNSNLDGGSSKG